MNVTLFLRSNDTTLSSIPLEKSQEAEGRR